MTEATKPKKYRWQLLAGPFIDESGHQYNFNEEDNNVIETDSDLGKMFNQKGMEKFREVRGISIQEAAERGFTDGVVVSKAPAGVVNDGFDAMTIDELRKWAEEEEINVSAYKKKSAIVRAIRSALAVSPVSA